MKYFIQNRGAGFRDSIKRLRWMQFLKTKDKEEGLYYLDVCRQSMPEYKWRLVKVKVIKE